MEDLVFFNEFERDLAELIEYFTTACQQTDDMQQFSEIAMEFYYGTRADGYNALAALHDIFEEGSDKRKIIDYLISEEKHHSQADVAF